MRVPSPKHIALTLLAFGLFLVLQSPSLRAEESFGNGFVYVMSNKNTENSVIQFKRAADGSLNRLAEVATGGKGTGATAVDPLGSQDSLVLSGDGRLLFAVNAGSNEVSVLEIRNRNLRLLSKTASGGDFPNSIALSGDLVYVLNSKGTPNITGFRLDTAGVLHAITRVDLPPGSVGPNDVRFSPDGTRLIVSVAATNQLIVYGVGDDGVARNPMTQASAGQKPFGVRFGRGEVTIVSEAAGSVSSYLLDPLNMLDVISPALANGQKATCWVSLTRSGRYAFASNTGSGTISSYAVDLHGVLTLVNAVAANPGGAPIDSSLSRDSRFLYVVDSAQGRVLSFRVDGADLTSLGQITGLPKSIQGIAAW